MAAAALAALAMSVGCMSAADAGPQAAPPGPEGKPPLRFSTDGFWLNLHHFLYVLGRAEAKAPDAGRPAVAGAPADAARGLEALTAEQRLAWRESVAFYAAGPSKLDLIFDRRLAAAARALGAAVGSTLDGVDIEPATRGALERAAPLYRAAWWPAHRAANQAWAAAIAALLAEHGARMVSLITGWYRSDWPADGYPVHLSAYSNWAGAYSTTGNLLVVSSLDRDLEGSQGLEVIFHEAMHQWDDAMDAALATAARAQRTTVPDGLSHAMIFFTAGEAARRTVQGHVPYAERSGVWQRSSGRFLPALETAWRPYLDGQGTRDDALAALVRRAAAPGSASPSALSEEQIAALRRGAAESVLPEGPARLPLVGTPSLPLVEAWINGAGPMRLLVDLGSNVTILRRDVVDAAQIEVIVDRESSDIVRADTLRLGSASFRDIWMGAYDELDVDGVVGYNLLSSLPFTLDIPNRRLVLGGVELTAADPEYVVAGRLPYLPARIGDRELLLNPDTGAAEEMTVPAAWEGSLPVAGQLRPGPVTYNNQTGSVRVRTARLGLDLRVGELVLGRPVVYFNPDAEDAWLGCGILQHYSLSMDPRIRRYRLIGPADRKPDQ